MTPLKNEEIVAILKEGAFLDEKVLNEMYQIAIDSNTSLDQVIIGRELMTDDHLGQILASALEKPFVNLKQVSIPDEILSLIPEEFAQKNHVIAFEKDEEGLHVAMNNVKDIHLIQLLEKSVGQTIVVHYATDNDIHQALNLYKRGLVEQIRELAKVAQIDESAKRGKAEDTQIIRIIDLLLDYAYTSKASDMHVEPQDLSVVVRFRVDGVLRDVISLPKTLLDRIVTRIKILSQLRTDEHYAAQDGHMSYNFSGEKVDIRVSIVPTTYGEKMVLRLLSEKTRQYSLEELGLEEKDFTIVRKQMHKPWGMILVTGPTGSGKTTSLYAVLKLLNKREVNISTIEDPVEYSIPGVNQIQVNARTNLTFADGLRSIVRQDPNIIMVGEIRDTETADIAINAALTGHLVLSTLHTNDAATALPRLLDMDVEPFLVASTVNMVIAQRLMRKVCMNCVTSYSIDAATLEQQGYFLPDKVKSRLFADGKARRLYKGAGCAVCNNSGYRGRTGVFEILEVDTNIKKMIMDEVSSDVISDYAIKNGMTTMMDDAINKVMSGQTTIEEILRVVR